MKKILGYEHVYVIAVEVIPTTTHQRIDRKDGDEAIIHQLFPSLWIAVALVVHAW